MPILLGLFLFFQCINGFSATAVSFLPFQNLGQDKQLFIDESIIENLDGLTRSLNQPTRYGPNPIFQSVPSRDSTWEAGMLICFTSILFDGEDSIYKMWYSLWGPEDRSMILAYATSLDGIHWKKPSLGIVGYKESKDNNIILVAEGLEIGVFKDLHEVDPGKRYKMLRSGIRASYSADGLHWKDYNQGQKVIFHSPGHDTQPVPYWDGRLGRYVAIIRDRTGMIRDVRKAMVTNPVARKMYRKHWGGVNKDRVPENHSLRRVGQVESDDFVHWTPMRTIVAADGMDPLGRDQFYNMQVLQYEGLRIGLMTVFSYDLERPRGAVQLTYSQDGLNWHRGGNREVFLPLSPYPEDFDWGFVWPVQGPLIVGDEIWIYYVGWNADHNSELSEGVEEITSGIGLSRLRMDGFISIDSDAEGGSLITKPFFLSGENLYINADAGSGAVQVEVLDISGNHVEGLSRNDSDALSVDTTCHHVTWDGKSGLGAVQGKVIRLKFYLAKKARLFSFWIRGD